MISHLEQFGGLLFLSGQMKYFGGKGKTPLSPSPRGKFHQNNVIFVDPFPNN
jgi:hypothetical protein